MTTSKWNTQVLKSLNINWLILLHSPLSPKHTNDKIFVQLFHIIISAVERKKRVVEFLKNKKGGKNIEFVLQMCNQKTLVDD